MKNLHPEVASPFTVGRHVLVLSAFAVLLASTTAFAGTVYGNVTKNARPISTTLSFTAQDGQKESVRTDRTGRYELILPPGDYSITSAAGDVLPRTIAVFHEPQQQDISVQAAP